MLYLISQIIETVALIITLTAYHRKNKDKIFKQMMISNVFDMFHYLLLGAYSGVVTKFIALIRNFVIIKKEKSKNLNSNIILFLFIIIYLIFGIFTYQNLFSLFPLIAAIIYMIVCWNGDALEVKKIAFLCYFLWLAYNISVFTMIGIISNLISLISTYIAYHKEKMKRF